MLHAEDESRPFGRKIDPFQKTTKNDLFEWQEIGITSLWEDVETVMTSRAPAVLKSRDLVGCY